MFHKVVWQHMQSVAEFLITMLLQIYQGIFRWISVFKNRLRFDRIVDEFVTSLLLAHPVLREYIDTDDTSHACLCLCVCTTFHHSLSGVQVQVTFVKLVERWTLDIRRIFEISKLEYSGIYYSS